MKNINSHIPYFPPDVISAAPVTPTILPNTDLKDFLDGNLPQFYKDICRKKVDTTY